MKHGLSGFNNNGCRCAKCRAAKARYQQEYRVRKAQEPTPDHVHGSENGYTNYGCRCERCKGVHVDAQRVRRELRAAA